MTFPIFVQYVKEHFMPHGLRLVGHWDAKIRIGGGRFTVLYDFPDEKLARSLVNKRGFLGFIFYYCFYMTNIQKGVLYSTELAQSKMR